MRVMNNHNFNEAEIQKEADEREFVGLWRKGDISAYFDRNWGFSVFYLKIDSMKPTRGGYEIHGIGRDRINRFTFGGKLDEAQIEIELKKTYDRGPHKDGEIFYNGEKVEGIFSGPWQRRGPNEKSTFGDWWMAPVDVIRDKLSKKRLHEGNGFELNLLQCHLESLGKFVADIRYYSKAKPLVPEPEPQRR